MTAEPVTLAPLFNHLFLELEAPSIPSLVGSPPSWEAERPAPYPNLSCSSYHDDVTMAEMGAGELLGTVDNGTSKWSVF